MTSNPEFDAALAKASDDVHDLAVRARALVLDVLPLDVLETVDGTDIGYGWTRGYAGMICVISGYPRWINLGLPLALSCRIRRVCCGAPARSTATSASPRPPTSSSRHSANSSKPPAPPTPGLRHRRQQTTPVPVGIRGRLGVVATPWPKSSQCING